MARDPDRVERPLDVLSAALDAQMADLEQRRNDFIEMRAAVLRLRAIVDDESRTDAAEPLPLEFAAEQTERLLDFSEGLVRTSILTVEEGPGTDEAMVRDLQERVAEGFVQRALYDAQVAATASGRRWMDSWAAVGEEQRIATTVPGEFAVFGSHAVVATSEWKDTSSGYVLIRNPMIVAAFAALFDLAYGTAVPVVPRDQGEDEHLIQLLALGMKDEAIARYLGWGLRTVRRRVARLMEIHGVDTRFQLGAAVTAAGRVGPRRRTTVQVRGRAR
ncbi:putative transcriptional regulator [Nostocoides japonicum T1-X7]|uniref:Putative transcriptional regulator n=1 Tax=Nostocoides japonicum T1-X7 TaxID=1194083 RepID=A0A077M5I9_9MICO|nr:helix-turn-helix domain-containing protein [Tetrasphaera japonica]CCH79320.1 putative transcriptional regulator [Tetrasphaera japonica T1-X7]